MSSLQEMLDREIAKRGPDGFMVKQLRNQIMAEKRNQSTRQMYTSGITANHSPKADAQVELGVMYGKGLGMPADRVKSVELYKLAAEQGVAVANFNLGLIYINGDGMDHDLDLGVRYMSKAAHLGMNDAKEVLVMLKTKHGIESEQTPTVQ